jgi:UDP-glucose 4-epimerase
MNVLVTGGAGYIGSHAVRLLCNQGHQVVVVDDLSKGQREAVDPRADFAPLCTSDTREIAVLLRKHSVDAIMHFAAFIEVGESVQDPLKYYANNVASAVSLLRAAQDAGVQRFVFSSTAAVYGNPLQTPIPESATPAPINPYGRSKRFVEEILEDAARAYRLGYVVLRYFNVAGASPDAAIGEAHEPETHLIPNILLAALRNGASLSLFGSDYPTPDGTCIRDYVHVEDLVAAHALALDSIEPGTGKVFNLGSQSGFSVREVIKACEEVTGRAIRVEEKARRPGDPAVLVASSEKARRELGWAPRYPDLHTIIEHAWAWHRKQKDLSEALLSESSPHS